MFKNNLLLKAAEHGTLRVADTTDWRFAAGEMLLPVVYSEMADVAREYPLLFLRGKPLVYALTGIEQGINAYVGSDGRWLATYVPARLRSYPFALTHMPDKPGEFAIVLDADAPQLMQPGGHILFENSQPSPYLQQRMALLKAMQQAEPVTQAMVKVIQEADILIERNIRINRPDGQTSQLTGLLVVDETKLNQMPHEAFARLRDKGVLPLIYAHLLSMANLRQGVLAGKYPQLAAKKQADINDLLQTETIRFN
ncbi:SapC family protein [Nitrosomonas sp. ANs5]|uniref:SapC family protein n=1 Tax=Nitrosomonas sp. ANs5 TaxID=3423941 RepID=UPI003D353CCA